LYLATADQPNPEAIESLLRYTKHELLHHHAKLSLDFPVSSFDDAIQNAGFKAIRTLIWMHATL
jgi:hypothetical protein